MLAMANHVVEKAGNLFQEMRFFKGIQRKSSGAESPLSRCPGLA
jgi:hypothetical protein